MYKTTVDVEGMMCGMCESHINDAVRAAVNPTKVTSSRKKKVTEIISENELDEEAVKKAIADTGYEVKGYKSEPYEKKGKLFGLL